MTQNPELHNSNYSTLLVVDVPEDKFNLLLLLAFLFSFCSFLFLLDTYKLPTLQSLVADAVLILSVDNRCVSIDIKSDRFSLGDGLKLSQTALHFSVVQFPHPLGVWSATEVRYIIHSDSLCVCN